MLPRTVSHYEVGEKLGQGGMGTVYKGRDLRLGRLVALKFLAADLLDSTDARARFLREGRALSSLNHPHIATVYEVDEAEGVPFLVLEYLPRGTLRARIRAAAADGRHLDFRDAVHWCAGVAEALAHAHRQGVIHRDVKSSNVMFDGEGRVRLTDFGLAKVTQETRASVPGSVLGTFPYMSPEQVTGSAVDKRSDLFSLGVVLYETAAGRLPFTGDSPAAVVHSIAHTEPLPVSQVRRDLPAEFERILSRLLAKAPDDRYQRAEDVASDLRALCPAPLEVGAEPPTVTLAPSTGPRLKTRRGWLAAAIVAAIVILALAVQGPFRRWLHTRSLPPRKHVAVLPFRNIGGEAGQQAFCDGLTETLTTALTKYGDLSVVPPTEARRLENARQARREFGVNLVVYGSVQRRRDRVRLIISLIDAERQRQIDAEPIDWPLAQLYELEDGVLTKVADLLNLVMAPPPSGVLAAGATQLPGAHDAYLRGRGFLYRYDKAGNLERAGQQFEEAIRADPKFAAAHVGLAETHLRAYRTRKDPALLDAARNQAQRARELSPQLASARVILGGVLAESRQQQEAVRELEAAIQLDPREPAAYRELARLYWSLARYRDAEQLYQKAIAARPGDWMTYSFAARFYVTWQHYQEAERYFRKAIELTPDNPDAYRNLGGLLAKLGREREAEAMMLKAQTLNPIATGYSNLATLYMVQGRYKDAVPMAEQAAALAAQMPKAYLIWGNLGDAYWLARADPAKAREAWRKAAQIAQEEAARAPADTIILSYLAKYQAKLGDAPGALQRLEAARRQAPDNGAVRYQAGLAYALLGKNDPALRELAAALDRKFPVEEVQKAPELAPLREDPRYQQLIAQAVKRKGN